LSGFTRQGQRHSGRGRETNDHYQRAVQEFLNDDAAAGAIEFVLLAALIALGVILTMHNFGKKLTKDHKQIGKKI
jgi:Flp pilus assembly pilin Flp